MDPVAGQILFGVASNTLYDFIVRALGYAASSDARDAAELAVSEAIASLTDVAEIDRSLGGERCRDFLQSDETQNIIRQIYSYEYFGQATVTVKSQFRELWRARTGLTAAESLAEVDRLFDSLVAICERSLAQAIANGSLSALEANNARRHAELQDALKNVQQALDVFSRVSKPDIDRVDAFAATYRAQLAAREGFLTPPALDTARQFPIDDLYVPARLDVLDASKEQIDYIAFSKHLYRAVVLGNPGSGKSTLAKKLATDLASDQVRLSTAGGAVVPFLVVLRDFGAHKKDNPCSIVDFISLTCNARYQVPPPPGAIEYLLATSRAVVIFDGLDELLDTSHRAEISGDVESLASLYPSVPILVTSREVGYSQAPLSGRTFPTFRLAEFTGHDVHRYARNWFGVEADVTAAEAGAQAVDFMADSSSVEDLRANALMLGLMCNLYKGSGYIPRNRPDVYEACAEMLFDRWDRLRQINVGLNIESLLRPTMQHLAFWIYRDPELQSGVTEERLVEETSDYLLGRRFDNRDDAELEARRFIEFCRGRAWVFTDTGTRPSGERLYQFTHRTFLEFFAAGHLVRSHPSPDELLGVLAAPIAAKEWDVVAQLAFQLLERNVDGAANSMLNSLVPDCADPDDEGEGNRLDFAVRCLEFLVPSPAITKTLAATAVDRCMEWAKSHFEPEEDGYPLQRYSEKTAPPVETVLRLLRANPENIFPVRTTLEERLLAHLSDPASARYAAEIALNIFRWPLEKESHLRLAAEVSRDILEAEETRLVEIAELNAVIAQDLVWRGVFSVGSLVERYGLTAFFRERAYILRPGELRVSLGATALSTILWGDASNPLSTAQTKLALEQLADPLSRAELPWYEATEPFAGAWPLNRGSVEGSSGGIEIAELAPPQRFALVAIACAYLDQELQVHTSEDIRQGVLDETIRDPLLAGAPCWAAISPILLAKLGDRSADEAAAAMDALEIAGSGRQVLERWVGGEVALVRVERPEDLDEDEA